MAGANTELEARCADYGQALGAAFQVVDDVLDYEGNAAELGKNLGDDLREGKATLPLIIAMQRASASDAALVRQAIENGSTDQLETIASIVRQTGALVAAREAAASEARRAITALESLPANEYSANLLQLAAQLLDRRT